MNKLAEKELLMAYLYQELDGEALADFEQHLHQHPELQAELQALTGTRQLMEKWNDHEVEVPIMMVPGETQQPGPAFLQRGWVRTAAVILLMLGSSALTAMWMQHSSSVGQGLHAQGEANAGSTYVTQKQFQQQQKQMQNWLQQSLFQQQDSMYRMMSSMNASMMQEIQGLRQTPAQAVDPTQLVELNDQQFQILRTEIIEENYQMLTDLLNESHRYQQEYTKNLLGNFASYMEEQRTEDLQRISYGLEYLKEHGDQRHQETELFLTQLVANIQQTGYNNR